MKPALIALIALPALSLAAGYGGGLVLAPSAPEQVEQQAAEPAPEASAAEKMLGEAGASEDHATDSTADPVPTDRTAPIKDSHAKADKAEGKGKAEGPADPVVTLGRLTVPVYKPRSVTYVVADFGISVPDVDTLSHYSVAENAARLRDAILKSLTDAAGGTLLAGASIDSDALARAVKADIDPKFHGIDEVLFLGLYKTDVPRS